MSARAVVPGIALALLSGAATSGDSTTPPRQLGTPGNATDNCFRLHSREGEVSGEADVAVSVNAHGRVTSASR